MRKVIQTHRPGQVEPDSEVLSARRLPAQAERSDRSTAESGRTAAADRRRGDAAWIVALQRTAGNRAVAGMVGRRRELTEDDQAAINPEISARRPVGGGGGAAQWGTASAVAPATLFGRGREPERRSNPFTREVQRYTTTDGVVANAASIIGLGGPTAALTGAVTFESSGFTASVAKALAITKTAADLTIDSQTYSASGTVKASGPKDRVGAYEIGFLQTVYESSRNFYYEPTPYTPGLLARLAPTIFGERKKIADTLSTLPVRDGDAGKRPWYGMETVDQFAKTDPSTKASTMSDTPGSFMGWTTGSPPNEQHLVKTDGYDKFRSWLAVKDKSSQTAIPLNYADWEVNYGTTVTFNKASPAASVVTPTATSGSKVTGTGDGSGGKWPIHNDPVANDVTTTVTTTW